MPVPSSGEHMLPEGSRVMARPVLGGLHHEYRSLKQLFDWRGSGHAFVASGLGAFLGGRIGASIAGGLVLAAKIGAFLCERKIASNEILRGPDRAVAILYEAQERLPR
jgi:hypothetical protein